MYIIGKILYLCIFDTTTISFLFFLKKKKKTVTE